MKLKVQDTSSFELVEETSEGTKNIQNLKIMIKYYVCVKRKKQSMISKVELGNMQLL